MKKEIYILIGPAAIGKTTFVKNAGFPKGSMVIVSRDDVVNRVSLQYGLSFDDLYHFPPHDSQEGDYIPGFEKYGRVIVSPSIVRHLQPFSYEYLDSVNAEINYAFYNEFQSAIRRDDVQFIIVDRVHLRSNERKTYARYLDINRDNFVVVGVLFNFQDADSLDVIEKASKIRTEHLIKDGVRPRTVSRSVQEKMIKHYEEPQLEEGFDSIIHVNTLPALREFINQN